MEIYPLLYFQAIAETGNLTRAAEKLMISPPALSNALKRLERDLGVELFDRVGRSLVLNRYGEAYLPYVRQILSLTHQSRELLQQMREEQQKHLSIADTTYVFASHLISEFLKRHPQIRLHRTYITPAEGKSIDLIKGYDLAIGSSHSIQRAGLEHIHIRSGQTIVAIVNRAHPMAKQETVSMQELAAEPMIAYASGQPGRIMLEQLFREIDSTPSIIYEGNAPHAMAPALERNLGVFLQASHTARFNMPFYADCVSVTVRDAAYRADTSLFWAAERPLSQAAKLFCQFCEEYSRSNQQEVFPAKTTLS